MLKRQPLGLFIASTFLFGMMFIEPTPFIAPFFPGLTSRNGAIHPIKDS
jgi:hypothetical protein